MKYYIDNTETVFRTYSTVMERFSPEGKDWCVVSFKVSVWDVEEMRLTEVTEEAANRIVGYQLLKSVDYNLLKELVGFLRTYKVEWIPGHLRGNRIRLSYPNYDERVFSALEVFGFNNDYEYDPQLPQCISKLTVLQIRDYLSHITIEERCCAGFIAELIDAHIFHKLFLRLLELYHQHFRFLESE